MKDLMLYLDGRHRIVRMLEDLVDDVRAGKYVGVAVATLMPDQTVGSWWDTLTVEQLTALGGAVSQLAHRFVGMAFDGITTDPPTPDVAG